MRAVQLVAPRRLEPCEIAAPRDPGHGEVLVRIHAVGLCGSDMHWYAEGGIGAARAVYPMILGHEPAGEIVAAGPGVHDRKSGDRVAIEPTISCGRCEHCLRGAPNNCPQGIFQGGLQAPGFFREYAVAPAHNTDLVPGDMPFDRAALVEPVAVVVHVFELIQARAGDTVAVVGAGSIGLLCIALARRAGASRIFAADRVPHRLALARRMGADTTVLAPRESLLDAVMDETRGRGADVAIEAAGSAETVNAAIAATRPGGQVAIVGLTAEVSMRVDLMVAMLKELRIQTVKRSNHRGAAAVGLLASGAIPDALVTHRLPLEKTPDAFEMLANYSDNAGKILLEASA
jgi:L-iditol 2-dehydrogenase